MKDNHRQLYLLLFVLALVVNFSGINLDFFTDDPGLYASISKNLIYRHQFFELFTYNQDWLDKPHFPFWMVMVSFKLFGISVWAYRLPALLFFLLGLRYTWLFSKKYYGVETAWIAVLIVSTAQHLVMSNTDVRAEPYLLALVIGSIYHISKLDKRFTITDMLLAALLTACAIMTKGIFVIVPIYGALCLQLLFQGRLRELFSLKWVGLVTFSAVFVLPELYALYIQFDFHPEKTVFGRHHVSGIKWFFWDSQFGRFVNNGPITRQSGDVFFYLHTLLWAFAPWCLVFYYAVYQGIKQIVQRKPLAEYYSIGGGLLLLLLFSLSRFQLPFYTNTVFPLFAIMMAPYCLKQLSVFGSYCRSFGLSIYILLLPVAVLTIHYFSEPGHTAYLVTDCLVFAIVAFMIVKTSTQPARLFFLACAASLFANFYLNTVFYKLVISYRGQIKAADYVNQKSIEKYHLYNLSAENNVYQFYTQRQVNYLPPEDFKAIYPPGPTLFFANQKTVDSLKVWHISYKTIKAFPNYRTESIYPEFINKKTRKNTIDSVYLISK
ncbi:ArnT family glycosyltransferase [Mucilaginibacter sp.]|jgi:4-amino-4-deoxy-L-arabinose transferase-like glycosyltransferase|uniref:ArnT family glycosyltransferase n=1 Tax=Mucilaginibacter sp. TaxID=1882438 RepID=UPI002BECD2A5|nr:glycosyltransferase family 39 protein [Mucilaginibacter sp.]HTI58316.1 glycosyltransferase family 39 protein [Mucilaginibacter sp.]